MSCERSSGFRGDALSLYFYSGSTVSAVGRSLLGHLLSLMVPRWQPRVGVSQPNNSFRSAWPKRANLSTCYSSQSVSRRLCCTMRNRRRALRSSHSPPDSNLAVFFNRITRQKHLTHLSRVISLPNHDVCLEYSKTLYEFG